VLDSDNDGFVDARECFGALAVLCKGHLNDRLKLLFDIFDLNKESDMGFDEVYLMLLRTSLGLRKITGLVAPPEQVMQLMAEQIWRKSRKHMDMRITASDWESWWQRDGTCRAALKAFVLRPEDQRGLPTPDMWINIDYSKDVVGREEGNASSPSLLAPTRNIRSNEGARSQAKSMQSNYEVFAAAMDAGHGNANDGSFSATNSVKKAPGPKKNDFDAVGKVPTETKIDYEELVREGQTDSPFLRAEDDKDPVAVAVKAMPVA